MVDCDSIVLTAFVVPSLPPYYYAKSGSQEASCAQADEDLQTSNYFVSLPPHADWKLIGWDRKLSSEEKQQGGRDTKCFDVCKSSTAWAQEASWLPDLA